MAALSLARKKNRNTDADNMTAHERLHAIDARIREARAERNQLDREAQLAADRARVADEALVTLEGRHAAGAASDDALDEGRSAYEAAKAEAERPWQRDVAVAGAKAKAIEQERERFINEHRDELEAAVTTRAEDVQRRIIGNERERGELAADLAGLQHAWRELGYSAARFPLEHLAQEWRKDAQRFDPASIPLIVPLP